MVNYKTPVSTNQLTPIDFGTFDFGVYSLMMTYLCP